MVGGVPVGRIVPKEGQHRQYTRAWWRRELRPTLSRGVPAQSVAALEWCAVATPYCDRQVAAAVNSANTGIDRGWRKPTVEPGARRPPTGTASAGRAGVRSPTSADPGRG